MFSLVRFNTNKPLAGVELVALVKCLNEKCEHEIVWHHPSLWIDIKCEKCGGKVKLLPTTRCFRFPRWVEHGDRT